MKKINKIYSRIANTEFLRGNTLKLAIFGKSIINAISSITQTTETEGYIFALSLENISR